jgi:integrase
MTRGRRGRGEGSIFQRADGRGTAAVDLGWSGGKRRRKTLYGATRCEVAGKLSDAVRAHREGRLIPHERATFAVFVDMWLSAALPH